MKKSILPYFPFIVLIVVFWVQGYNQFMHQLSPWRGGGFGMYTSFHPKNRMIRISFILNKKENYSFTAYPGEWGKTGFKTKLFPSPGNFKKLAQKIEALEWIYTDYSYTEIEGVSPSKNIPEALLFRPDSLKIELLEHQLNQGGVLSIHQHPINSFTKPWKK